MGRTSRRPGCTVMMLSNEVHRLSLLEKANGKFSVPMIMIRNTPVFSLPSGAGQSEVPGRLDSVEERECVEGRERVVEWERAEAQQ